jgi:tritrans,polycis-undecaprenyl-diphosphate synthase [geranylgeranyl-diphosphate specific]
MIYIKMKSSLKPSKVPKHVAIVLDGNRRFSRRLMIKPWMGHEWGANKVEKLLDWCKELKIKELTLYAFSAENFNRPKEEFDFLMQLFKKEASKLLKDPRVKKDRIKINFIGRISLFPTDLQKLMKEIMNYTKDNKGYTVNFAMAYGGRQEVIDAVKKMAVQIKKGDIDIDQINEETFSKNLYMEDEPDLIIRTGGEKRTSNFLIWQANYSEWIFLEKLWPEFEKEDFKLCIEEYSRRKRRFGR